MPNSGELVHRSMALEVPSRGQGDVVLRAGGMDLVAERFFTTRKNGRTVFYVVFAGGPNLPFQDTVVYRGTYLRGSNEAKYYGDIFKSSSELENPEEFDRRDWEYVGGFEFTAPVDL